MKGPYDAQRKCMLILCWFLCYRLKGNLNLSFKIVENHEGWKFYTGLFRYVLFQQHSANNSIETEHQLQEKVRGSGNISGFCRIFGSHLVRKEVVTGCSHQAVIGWKWAGQCQSNLDLDNKSPVTSSGWGWPFWLPSAVTPACEV